MLLLESALKYAELGFSVLPLHTVIDGVCSCSNQACRSAGKHPLIPHGLTDASPDETLIRGWWSKWPQANIGLKMGINGIVAVDVDTRHNGDATWAAIKAANGVIPETTTQKTGNGWHYLFSVGPEVLTAIRGKLGEGIDIKANGYIVAEPSVHHTGSVYKWEVGRELLKGFTPAIAPRWLERLMCEQPTAGTPVAQLPVYQASGGGWKAAITFPRQLDDARLALKVLDAEDYQQWIEAGMALHATGLGSSAYDIWVEWSQRSTKFDAQQQAERWNSFTVKPGGVSIATLFARAQRVGWVNPMTGSSPATPPVIEHTPAFRVEQGSEFAANFRSPEYSVDGILLRGYLHGLTGLSNAGKTAIALALAVSVATGTPFGGRAVEKGRVLFMAGENPEDLRLRIKGVEQFYNVQGKLNDISVAFARFELLSNLDALRALAVQMGGFDLVIVDSSAAFFSGTDENSNPEMVAHSMKLRCLTELAGRPAVLVVCHPSKHASSVESLLPRGGSAFLNELDANLTAHKDGEVVSLHWNKLRGPAFEPVQIKLEVFVFEHIKTNLGSKVTSVVAVPVDAATSEMMTARAEEEENRVLMLLGSMPGITVRGICEQAGWINRRGEPMTSKVHRLLASLEADKLIRKYRRKWVVKRSAKRPEDGAKDE